MKPRLTHGIVRGAPFEVNGREFVPEARVTTLAAQEARLGTRATSAASMRFMRVRPTALIERTPRGERRHQIGDPTGRILLGLAVAACAVALVLNALAKRLTATRQ